MAKQFIMYNLKDGVTEEDFDQWVHDFKGPLVTNLTTCRHYCLSKVEAAMEVDGWPPKQIDIPYRYFGIMDLTSLDGYSKDQASEVYQKEFMPAFRARVDTFVILKAEEVYEK